jgi:hypothetical protein
MNWTTSPPTRPGFYWFKNIGTGPTVVKLSKPEKPQLSYNGEEYWVLRKIGEKFPFSSTLSFYRQYETEWSSDQIPEPNELGL